MAEYIAWKPFYSVGDSSIDAQHQEIFEMINELYAAVVDHKEDVDLKEIMDRLIRHADSHSKYEEHIMQECGYPEIAFHQKLHEQMRRHTLVMRNNISLVSGKDVLVFLKDWWCNHIMEEDKEYSPYLGMLTH